MGYICKNNNNVLIKLGEIEHVFEEEQTKLEAAQHALEHIKEHESNQIDITTLEPEIFFGLMAPLSAQKKAPIIEYYICKKMGWDKIPASKNAGDAVDRNGKHYELKTSTTNESGALNARQIRLWQDIDYYVLSYIDEINLPQSFCYILSHEEMEKEVELHGSATHGTSSANQSNENIEYSLTILPNMRNQMHEYAYSELEKQLGIA